MASDFMLRRYRECWASWQPSVKAIEAKTDNGIKPFAEAGFFGGRFLVLLLMVVVVAVRLESKNRLFSLRISVLPAPPNCEPFERNRQAFSESGENVDY
jgi:hypothetical protein